MSSIVNQCSRVAQMWHYSLHESIRFIANAKYKLDPWPTAKASSIRYQEELSVAALQAGLAAPVHEIFFTNLRKDSIKRTCTSTPTTKT